MIAKRSSTYYWIKNNYVVFYIGDVVKVFYIVRKRKKKRIYNFIGLCISKTSSSFILFNKLKKEKILFTFPIFTPAILAVFKIYMYKPFIFRVGKMYFKKNLFVKDDNNFYNLIYSTINSYTFDYNSFYINKRIVKRKVRKYKYKYKYRKIVNAKEVVRNKRESEAYKILTADRKKGAPASRLFKKTVYNTFGSLEYNQSKYIMDNKSLNFVFPRKMLFRDYYTYFMVKINLIINK